MDTYTFREKYPGRNKHIFLFLLFPFQVLVILAIKWEKAFFSKKLPPCGGTFNEVSPVYLQGVNKKPVGINKTGLANLNPLGHTSNQEF
jgi:hypothetical protein